MNTLSFKLCINRFSSFSWKRRLSRSTTYTSKLSSWVCILKIQILMDKSSKNVSTVLSHLPPWKWPAMILFKRNILILFIQIAFWLQQTCSHGPVTQKRQHSEWTTQELHILTPLKAKCHWLNAKQSVTWTAHAFSTIWNSRKIKSV